MVLAEELAPEWLTRFIIKHVIVVVSNSYHNTEISVNKLHPERLAQPSHVPTILLRPFSGDDGLRHAQVDGRDEKR